MTGFDADWLALREPADAAARSAAMCRLLRSKLARRPLIRCVDLGAGSGANLRHLAPRLGRPQHWVLVEQDPLLLSEVELPSGVVVTPLLHDLSEELSGIGLERADLVTASALLDLVSGPWLESLVAACRRFRATLHFALTVDGRIAWSPQDPDDEAILAAFRQHQRGDKGFGPALGPDAPRVAARLLRRAGYRLREARSDWCLGPEQEELQAALAEGQAAAAAEIASGLETEAWLGRRLDSISEGRSRLVIGHRDLLAWPRP